MKFVFFLGSAGFLFADTLEWFTNNRMGCINDDSLIESYELSVGRYYQSIHTWSGKFQRAENGLNFFTSIFGSFLYFVGSVLYIPETNAILYGTYIYIIGSAIIAFSQSWKLYRSAKSNNNDLYDRKFKFSNWSQDYAAFGIDFFAGAGGLAYLIGSVYFLPQYDYNDHQTWIGAVSDYFDNILYSLMSFID